MPTENDKDDESFRLFEDCILVQSAANDAAYKASRHQLVGYDHLREEAIEELKSIGEMVDEIVERHENQQEET